MKQDDLIRDADEQLRSFSGAKTVREAEVHYRELMERIIPAIDAADHTADHTLGAAVEHALRELVAAKVALRYIPAT